MGGPSPRNGRNTCAHAPSRRRRRMSASRRAGALASPEDRRAVTDGYRGRGTLRRNARASEAIPAIVQRRSGWENRIESVCSLHNSAR